MVRFAWKRDIGKKAKIMRRVKFPAEYDALDIATPELKEKLLPISRKLKEFEKERSERRKVRKRTKAALPVKDKEGDVQMADADAPEASSLSGDAAAPAAEGEDKGKAVAVVDLEEESVYREREGKELEALLHADIKADVGASTTGQYELVGELPSFYHLYATSSNRALRRNRHAQGCRGGRRALHRLREEARAARVAARARRGIGRGPGRGRRGLVQVRRRQGVHLPRGEARDAFGRWPGRLCVRAAVPDAPARLGGPRIPCWGGV